MHLIWLTFTPLLDCCLKKTGVNVDLLTNPDMLLMFKRGTRGSITQAVHRYAQANNKYVNDLFDPTKESHCLQYLDANNLYSCMMSQNPPTGRSRWVSNLISFRKALLSW